MALTPAMAKLIQAFIILRTAQSKIQAKHPFFLTEFGWICGRWRLIPPIMICVGLLESAPILPSTISPGKWRALSLPATGAIPALQTLGRHKRRFRRGRLTWGCLMVMLKVPSCAIFGLITGTPIGGCRRIRLLHPEPHIKFLRSDTSSYGNEVNWLRNLSAPISAPADLPCFKDDGKVHFLSDKVHCHHSGFVEACLQIQ